MLDVSSGMPGVAAQPSEATSLMATDSENALLIALNLIVVLLEEKGALTRKEFTDALRLEMKGRPIGVSVVLDEISRQLAPKAGPTLTSIEGGKQDDPDEGPEAA
jgi:hypothetical protein